MEQKDIFEGMTFSGPVLSRKKFGQQYANYLRRASGGQSISLRVRIKMFDAKFIGDYMTPIAVSFFTTVVLLLLYFWAKK